jgi:hypothetical protein
MDLVDLCKIIGILLLIIMCWFFVFTVFKTNKDVLMSFTGNTVEGFSGDQLTQLENIEQVLSNHNKTKRKLAQLDDDGKEDQRKLITKIIEKAKEGAALNLVTPDINKGRGVLEYNVEQKVKMLSNYEGLEKIQKLWNGFLKESEDSGW